MNAKERDRRRFLKGSAALAGLAVGAIRSPEVRGQTLGAETPEVRPKDFRAYGEPSRFETAARASRNVRELPGSVQAPGQIYPLKTPLQHSQGIITPSGLHFTTALTHGLPDLDPRQHRLLIHGLVDRPLIFTLEELKSLPSVSRIYFIECAGNTRESIRKQGQDPEDSVQIMHGRTSCSEWTGVSLSLLLQEAGVQKGASWLIGEGAEEENDRESIPIEKAMDDVLVAYGQNGEALRREQGYPLRLVVPGWEGQSSIKWLRRIKLVDQPYMDHGESTLLPDLRPDGKAHWFRKVMGPKSVITRPSGGQRLPSHGFSEITGLAWSGGGAIRRVEVSTDGGRSWKDAQLQEPVHRMAHTRFRFDWKWGGEEAVLQSRCTDERGYVQPTLAELMKIWGINLEYLQSQATIANHFNFIQPWKVTREGSVHNALL